MKQRQHFRAFLPLLTLTLFVTLVDVAWAIPFSLENPFVFRDNRSGGASGLLVGDFLQIDVGRLPSDVPAATTATVRTVATNEVFNLLPCEIARDRCAFIGFIPYSATRADSDYLVEAINGTDTDSLLFSAYGTGSGTNALPFVENVMTVNIGLTPTFTWNLPVELIDHNANNVCPASNGTELNDCNVDRLRVRVWEEDPSLSSGIREIFDTRVDLGLSLPLNNTSYSLPPGFITGPGSYKVGVFIEGFTPFNRARVREDFTIVSVSLPATITLLAVGLLSLSLGHRRWAGKTEPGEAGDKPV